MPGQAEVDVSYRGLAVGTGLPMRDFGPTTACVEVARPMPVGTELEVAAGDGVRFAARVVHVQEKSEGVETASMRIAVDEIDGTSRSWWDALVTTEDPVPLEPAAPPPPEDAAAAQAGEAPEADAPAEAVPEAEPAAGDSGADAVPAEVGESRQTLMMNAVDLEEIQRMAAGESAEEFAAREAEAAAVGVTESEPDNDKKKKRKRRRKKKS